MKYTNIKLQTLQDEELLLSLEKNFIGGCMSSVIGDRYVKPDDTKRSCTLMLANYMADIWVNLYLMMKLRCGVAIQLAL